MVLIDKEKGVLTQLTEFLTDSNYEVQAVAKPVAMSDILRVHEYRYIKNVIKKCQELDYL
jgi:DNA-binding response OmpR family regulator